MVLTCPRCGRIAGDEGAAYCPSCGSVLRGKPAGKTVFLMAAGILAIITACMCAVWGIAGMAKFLDYMGYYDYVYYHFELPIGLFLTDGVLGLLGFARAPLADARTG